MEFEAALAQEAIGVFGRTGLTPSQLADQRAVLLSALKGVLDDLDNVNRLMGLYDITEACNALSCCK